MRRILKLRGRGKATCDCILAIADATLAQLEIKLAETQRLADALRANLLRWRRAKPTKDKIVAEFCQLIESSAQTPI